MFLKDKQVLFHKSHPSLEQCILKFRHIFILNFRDKGINFLSYSSIIFQIVWGIFFVSPVARPHSSSYIARTFLRRDKAIYNTKTYLFTRTWSTRCVWFARSRVSGSFHIRLLSIVVTTGMIRIVLINKWKLCASFITYHFNINKQLCWYKVHWIKNKVTKNR